MKGLVLAWLCAVSAFAEKQPSEWVNGDNRSFYNCSLENGQLEVFSRLAGLDSLCDYQLAKSFFAHSDKKTVAILEVGGGYGRVVQALLQDGYERITALELSPEGADLLRKFPITGVEGDILQFSTPLKFDVILWLWSGIADFDEAQQIKALTILRDHLSSHGVIIIDTPVDTNATRSDQRAHIIDSEELPTYIGIVPSNEKIQGYASLLNLSCHHVEYVTTVNRVRYLHVLQ